MILSDLPASVSGLDPNGADLLYPGTASVSVERCVAQFDHLPQGTWYMARVRVGGVDLTLNLDPVATTGKHGDSLTVFGSGAPFQ